MKNVLYLLVWSVFSSILFSCTNEGSVQFEIEILEEQTDFYDLKITYPQIATTNKETMTDGFNKQMVLLIDSLKTPYSGEELKEKETLYQELKKENSQLSSDYKFKLTVDPNWYHIYNGILSVRLATYNYDLGAHGISDYISLNYDAVNGRVINNSDILNYQQDGFYEKLAELINKYAANPNYCFDINANSLRTQMQCINFTPSNIIFSFGHYEVGSYYCGTLVVRVPIDVLKEANLLANGFTLGAN